jgi:hypothetical protein
MKNDQFKMKNESRRAGQDTSPARRWVLAFFIFHFSFFIVGCMTFGNSRTRTPPPPVAETFPGTPEPKDLVTYLNREAAKLNSLDSKDLDLDIQADRQQFGVSGTLYCQKPRNFRMVAKMPALRRDEADIGSNDQEFWYWIRADQPPGLYHCSYTDLSRGVSLPFPFYPDFVLEALGMGARDPNGRYDPVRRQGKTLELIERTTSAQGQPMTKVTVFNNFSVAGTRTPQVAEHRLYDANNQPVCRAIIQEVQFDPATQTVVPHKVKLDWPALKLSLTLTLGDIAVNQPKSDVVQQKLFTRPHKPGYRDVDLARGPPMMTPTAIQRTGAYR